MVVPVRELQMEPEAERRKAVRRKVAAAEPVREPVRQTAWGSVLEWQKVEVLAQEH